jgi:hypothetical protein
MLGFQLKGVDIEFGFRPLRLRRRTFESSLIKTATPSISKLRWWFYQASMQNFMRRDIGGMLVQICDGVVTGI